MSWNSPDAPWRSSLQGARAHLGAGLVLQALAIALVSGYYGLTSIHAAFSDIVALRVQSGLLFPIFSTALFGGLLPWLFLRWEGWRGVARQRYSGSQGFALTLFWAYKGVEVSALYELQAALFGSGHGARVIVSKVVVDQFVYGPLWAAPTTTLVYEWVERRFDFPAIGADVLAPRWYRRKVLPILVSNIGVWLPAVAIIYLLPTALQLPLQNLVLCFFTLIVAHQTRSAPIAVG